MPEELLKKALEIINGNSTPARLAVAALFGIPPSYFKHTAEDVERAIEATEAIGQGHRLALGAIKTLKQERL